MLLLRACPRSGHQSLWFRREGSRAIRIRVGHLKRLPRDYTGERHIIVKELPSQDGWERAEYEEVPGPDPNPPSAIQGPTRLIEVMLVKPNPYQEPA